jgi:hypothetical protein
MNGGGSDQARPRIKKAYRAMKTISSTIVRIAVGDGVFCLKRFG